LEQYFEKNIPDAMSWMDVTESALTTVNNILKQVNTYCVQGSSDTLTATDRAAIAENLQQMKQQIYQEGNTNYAGRYVFTGYKTDSPLIFTEETDNLTYSITENISGEQIQISHEVTDTYDITDFDNTAITFDKSPQLVKINRIQLSYDNLSKTAPTEIRYFKENALGESEEQLPSFKNIVPISVTDPDAYKPAVGTANYIAETGEIIMSDDVYNELRTSENMKITYAKTGFSQGSLKPEHYFDCVMTDNDKPEQEPITYAKSKQEIQYEVNYNQKLTVNTEGSDSISHQIGRRIDDILSTVNDVVQTEEKIAEIDKRLLNTSLSTSDKERYEKMKEQLDTELELKKETMQAAFEKGITSSTQEQDRVNIAVADLGSRYVRLEMTENRLSSQKVDFEDLLSKNEDVDMVDTVIKYSAAETIYNAALAAASKVVQNTLLDFL
jgi:flagellar hook-associated protein 3 FlgL